MKKQEYRVIIENGKVTFLESSGKPLSEFGQRLVAGRVLDCLEPKRDLYLCRSNQNHSLLKIGVSGNVERRMKELNASLLHAIPCSEKTVWKLESDLHNLLDSWHVGGEWFDFSERTEDFIAKIRSFSVEGLLVNWIANMQRRRAAIRESRDEHS